MIASTKNQRLLAQTPRPSWRSYHREIDGVCVRTCMGPEQRSRQSACWSVSTHPHYARYTPPTGIDQKRRRSEQGRLLGPKHLEGH